jgi:UrcA family protein
MLRALTTASIFSLMIAAATATAAQAADLDTEYTVQVAYGDLNLSNPANAAILASRLRTAAATVCQRANTILPHMAKGEMQLCIDTAIDGAMSKLASNMNRAVYANLVEVRTQVASAD